MTRIMFHSLTGNLIVNCFMAYSLCLISNVSSWAADSTQADSDGSSAIEFNRDIRPILSDNCFYCHGPDKNHREADLRLDTETGLFGGEKQKSVVARGEPSTSKLIKRIISTDPDELMPPPDSGKKLTVEQTRLLQNWVKQGAKYEGHWAFQPVRKSKIENANSDSWEIDKLVRQKREKAGLKPVAEADRVTLLRRLYFDLTGLPPAPEKVVAFQNDKSANAYEKSVDELLASPEYGERMAMWWLDLVRYADTVGYHGDQEMRVSPFRQYVIESFNSNKRFNQFTREQIAGDLAEKPSREQMIASGYNRLGMMSAEGGVQDKEYLAKYIAERVRNVSGTWMGVTLGCSECHNHKFDPFTTKEFYQMEAFFADIKERGLYSGANSDGNWGPSIMVPTATQERAISDLDQKITALKAKFNLETPAIVEARKAWETARPVWVQSSPVAVRSGFGATLAPMGDGSFLAMGENPKNENYRLEYSTLPRGLTGVRLDVLPDNSLPKKGPGRAGNGNFVLTEFVLKARKTSGEMVRIPIKSARASYEQTGVAEGNPYGKWAVAAAIDNDSKGKKWGWAVMEKADSANSAIFMIDTAAIPADAREFQIELQQLGDHADHTIGRFKLSFTSSPISPEAISIDQPEIELILATPDSKRSPAQIAELNRYYNSISPLLEPIRKELAGLESARKELVSKVERTLVTESVAPRMVKILARGNWMDESGEVVKPGFPAAITTARMKPAGDRPLNRKDLADWILHEENPLTSRVFVNRIWKIYFGEALSRKVDDLGAQGKPPTHPELLDFLAGSFIESGWDVKQLIKSILMSETYRLSSVATPELKEKDPYNEFIARQGRFRLDAELVRDNALAVSGLLVKKLGGQSVKPYQPAGYWAYLNFPTREWQNGKGEELYRRGLYTHWQRQYLHPSLLAFDAPNREECTAERARSNTPLQALVLLNDPSYVEAARAFAELILKQGGNNDSARLHFAFMRALSRQPNAKEEAALDSLIKESKAFYQADANARKEFLSIGEHVTPAGVDPSELAAWTTAARVILNLHEMVTRN